LSIEFLTCHHGISAGISRLKKAAAKSNRQASLPAQQSFPLLVLSWTFPAMISQKIECSLISQKIACFLSWYLAMQNSDLLDSAKDARYAGNLLLTSMVASQVVVSLLASVHLLAAVVCMPIPRHLLFSVHRFPLDPAKPMHSVEPLMSVVHAAWADLSPDRSGSVRAGLFRDHSLRAAWAGLYLMDVWSHCLQLEQTTMMKNALR
jgi:hypothetical protein